MFERINEGMYWDKGLRLVEGCTKVSPGCDNCWSEGQCHIRKHQKNEKIKLQYPMDCTTKEGKWTGKIHCLEQNLLIPAKITKPTVFAVWNDLFHPAVPFQYIMTVWETLSSYKWHTFLILTKRPKQMGKFLGYYRKMKIVDNATYEYIPPKNIWLGVTAEDKKTANDRIPKLLKLPAAKRFVSIEPILGFVDIGEYLLDKQLRTQPYDHVNICQNKDGEDDNKRKGNHGVHKDRGNINRQAGEGMETQKSKMEQVDQENSSNPMHKKTSGTFNRKILSSSDNGKQQKNTCLSTSTNMDILSRGNPKGTHYKPQRWERQEQQPRELGDYDNESANKACGSNLENREDCTSMGGEKPHVQVNKETSGGDNKIKREWENTNRNIQDIQGCFPDNIKNSEQKNTLSWIICGGETGTKARPVRLDWVQQIRDDCKINKVPFYFKQWGEWLPWEIELLGMNIGADLKSQTGITHRLKEYTRDALNKYLGKNWSIFDYMFVQKVGRKAAGRKIDGIEYNETPEL